MLRDVVVDVALADRLAGVEPRFVDTDDLVTGVVRNNDDRAEAPPPLDPLRVTLEVRVSSPTW